MMCRGRNVLWKMESEWEGELFSGMGGGSVFGKGGNREVG